MLQSPRLRQGNELLLELEEGFRRMFTEEETARSQQWIDWLDEVRLLICSYAW
jgi:hypothetical protein